MKTHLIYKDKMFEISAYMDSLINDTHAMSATSKKFIEIVNWIKNSGRLSKEELLGNLNWGRGIKWSPYRRAIMKHPNIFDTMSEYPNYVWRE